MSRDAGLVVITKEQAAASAATTYLYYPIPVAFRWEGFSWSYQSAEANTDNTLDFVIEADAASAGSWGTTLFTNGNPNGLLDTSAVGVERTNYGNAASSGATAIAVTPTVARVAGTTIRVTVITAGSGTVPAINFSIIGHYLQPVS